MENEILGCDSESGYTYLYRSFNIYTIVYLLIL